MKRSKILNLLVPLVVIILLLVPVGFALAEGPTITGTGTLSVSGNALALTLTFPPAGGPVTGTIYSQTSVPNPPLSPCVQTFTGSVEGTFAGGDGGVVNGTLVVDFSFVCSNGQNEQHYSGTWSGNFLADGTGGGTWSAGGQGGPWQVTYSATEFQAAIVPPKLDASYFQRVYGLSVDEGDKGWSDDELRILDEVLKILPPDFLEHTALKRIARYETAWDADTWQLKPGVLGDYSPWDQRSCPGCAMTSNTIRIFDSAQTKYEFDNDENGLLQFKSTLLHELTHAYHYYKTDTEIYNLNYEAPIVWDFMNVTRITPIAPGDKVAPVANGDSAYMNGWGWGYTNSEGKTVWGYFGPPGSTPPSRYGGTSPTEDLADSVKFYVYDPDRLKNASLVRYNFIRDNIFGGLEYETGVPQQ